jgi:hypothetical protein
MNRFAHILATLCRAVVGAITLCAASVRRALLAAALLCACRASADVITDWNATIEAALRNPTPVPATQIRTLAIAHAAMFDAVNGIAGKYAPLRVTESAPPGARAEAAAAQAAHTALSSLLPAKQALFDAQLAASLAAISASQSAGESIARGRAWGETVAKQILAWRATDGSTQVLTYPGSSAAGQWRHAPNATAGPASLSLTVTIPFALASLTPFDPGPPYGIEDRMAAMATAAYAADVNESKARGGTVSTVRTPAQAELAIHNNIADIADINAIVRRSLPPGAKVIENARSFAHLNLAAFDAMLVMVRGNYKYGLWRPFQAINFADEDGNPATAPDTTWRPLVTNASHPEYPSARVTIWAAMLAAASSILGDDTPFTLTTSNPGAPAIAPMYSSFSELMDATIEARVNMGDSFRSSCTVGQMTGYAVARAIVASSLTPVQNSELVNVSVRGMAGRPGEMLIAGFVVEAVPKQVLIRGVGPGLQAFGVANALSDPRIEVFDRAGRKVAENDNWSSNGSPETAALIEAAAKAGAFPLANESKDAALLTVLAPGAYSIHATGVGGASGITLIEVYDVP